MRIRLTAATLAAFSALIAAAATPAEILDANRAATGGQAWGGKAALRQVYDFAGMGLTGSADSTIDLQTGLFVQSFVIGPQKGGNGFDGSHVWSRDHSGIITLQEGGDAVPLAVNSAFRNANLWWRADRGGAELKPAPARTENGASYEVLTITPKGGTAFEAWFESRTHLLFRLLESQGGVMNTTTFTDYRVFAGTMQPVHMEVSQGSAAFDQHLTLKSATFLSASDPAAYAVPATKAAADFAIAGGAASATFPFDLINNHIYAHVLINGKGPYYFIFDTGGVNVVTPGLAQELGAEVQGKTEVRGAGEGTSTAGMTHVDTLALGGAVVKDQLFMAYALDSLYPTNGVHMQGMVGYEVFRRFVTRIDYGARTVTLIDPRSFDPAGAGAPVKIAFNGNAAIVEGSYDGIPGKFQIDTGSRSALTLNAPFVAAHGIGKGRPSVTAVDGWGVGGPSRAVVLRGDSLRIGGAVEVAHPVTGLGLDKAGAFADPTLSGNIGGGTLKRFVVTFDYGHSTMYLKPVAGPVADLDTFDRAGTWFNVAAGGFQVVAVTPASPAAEAGLREGDLITAIDGRATAGIALPEARQRLRTDPAGTLVTLTIQRDGRPLTLKLTLRDLV